LRALTCVMAFTIAPQALAGDGDGADPQLIAGLRAEAVAYEHGEGVKKDPARAVEIYCRTAKFGDAEAQFSVGWMYANVRGVRRDDAVASFYFTLAATQGHERAQRMLRF